MSKKFLAYEVYCVNRTVSCFPMIILELQPQTSHDNNHKDLQSKYILHATTMRHPKAAINRNIFFDVLLLPSVFFARYEYLAVLT